MEVRKMNQLRVMMLSIKYNIMKQMTNKVTFLTNIIFMILNDATFIIQWIILFGIKKDFGGYELNNVLVLWGLAATVFGFSRLFFYKAFELPDLIVNGKLDSFLVQPKNVLISVITSDTSISAIGDILYGFIVVLFCHLSLAQFGLYVLFSITGSIIITAFTIILSCVCFKFVKGDVLVDTLSGAVISFATYPDTIFKNVVKLIFYTIIPVGLTNYLPLHIIIKFDLGSLFIVLGVTVISVILAFVLFNKGLKSYSSSNLMSSRV